MGLAVDEDEVAGANIHRQPRLDRIPAIVAPDQLVDGGEVPALGGAAPAPRKAGCIAAAFVGELAPCVLELALVRKRLRLDLAQPHHVVARPAERGDVALDARPEACARPQRLADERAPLEVALERDAVAALARVLGAYAPVAENLLALTSVHAASLCPARRRHWFVFLLTNSRHHFARTVGRHAQRHRRPPGIPPRARDPRRPA